MLNPLRQLKVSLRARTSSSTFSDALKVTSRLEIYTGVPLTPAMRDKMVQITVEVLGILATATKEMEWSRAS